MTPNPIVINLDGEVDIFGNILLSDNDELNVNGSLFFDGADQSRGHGHHGLAVGVVNLGDRSDADDCQQSDGLGPPSVNVGVFNQADDAAVVFEVRGEDDSARRTRQASIFAATSANLDGTAVVRLLTGLYDDATYASVVVAGVINGQWDNVVLDRDYLFFDVDAVYNDGTLDTVDLVLTRIPFDCCQRADRQPVGGGRRPRERLRHEPVRAASAAWCRTCCSRPTPRPSPTTCSSSPVWSTARKSMPSSRSRTCCKDIVTQQLQTVPEIGVRGEGFQLNSDLGRRLRQLG